jgi:hypothetical protein
MVPISITFASMTAGCCSNDANPLVTWNNSYIPNKWSDEYIRTIGDHSMYLVRYDGIYIKATDWQDSTIAWLQFFPDGYIASQRGLISANAVVPKDFHEIDFSRNYSIHRFKVDAMGAIVLQRFGIHEYCFHFRYQFGQIDATGRLHLTSQRWLNNDAPSIWGNVAVSIDDTYHFVPLKGTSPFPTGDAFIHHGPILTPQQYRESMRASTPQ